MFGLGGATGQARLVWLGACKAVLVLQPGRSTPTVGEKEAQGREEFYILQPFWETEGNTDIEILEYSGHIFEQRATGCAPHV